MEKWQAAVIAVSLMLVLSGCAQQGGNGQAQSGSAGGAPQGSVVDNQGSQQTGQVKFSEQPYYPYAYLISGDALSSDAQNAIAGFSIGKSAQADGSVQITLKALNPEYSDQSYVVKPGQQLYFIELSPGDDRAPDGEGNLRDDTAVLVDANGYEVNSG